MEDFSAVIIARNEAKTLPRLFKSLKGVNDIILPLIVSFTDDIMG